MYKTITAGLLAGTVMGCASHGLDVEDASLRDLDVAAAPVAQDMTGSDVMWGGRVVSELNHESANGRNVEQFLIMAMPLDIAGRPLRALERQKLFLLDVPASKEISGLEPDRVITVVGQFDSIVSVASPESQERHDLPVLMLNQVKVWPVALYGPATPYGGPILIPGFAINPGNNITPTPNFSDSGIPSSRPVNY